MKSLILIFPLLLGALQAQECLTPIEINGALSVQGNRVVNAAGEPAPMAGNSFFWSNRLWGGEDFYTRETVEYLVEDWNTSIVRAAMGVDESNGFFQFPQSNLGHVETLIDVAIDMGLYVIVDWHSHHAEDFREEAVTFFTDIASRYGHHPNIIYEIYNEPLDISWSNTIKPYAEEVIEAIRAEDPDNLIIVGTPFFSQKVDEAAADPLTGPNIAYTIHFYAGTHRGELRQRAQDALDSGIALFCTEWGTVNASGDGAVDAASTDEWIQFLATNEISHCNWAVNNKNEGASTFLPTAATTGGWTDADLSPSGLLVKDIVLAWGIACNDNDSSSEPEAPWVRHFSPLPQGDISFEFEVVEDWGNGFNGNIHITNNGTAVDGYDFSFTAPWIILNYWNDIEGVKENGVHTISVFDHEWLSALGTGVTQTIGFTADGAAAEPSNFLFNGQPLTAPPSNGQLTFTQWQESFNISEGNTDFDEDGFHDLLEFLMGTEPNNSGSIPNIGISSQTLPDENPEEDYLVVEFDINPLAQNVEYRFESSADLTNWQSTQGVGGFELLEQEELSSGMLKIKLRSTTPLTTLGTTHFTRMSLREVE